MGLQSQPLGFQGNGTARQQRGVQQRRRVVAGGAQDFRLCRLQNFRIIGIFPLDQFFQNGKQALPLLVLFLFGGELLRVLGGIRPPGWTRSPHGLRLGAAGPTTDAKWRDGRAEWIFPGGFGIDGFQWKRHFNQFFRHGSILISGTQSPRCGSGPLSQNSRWWP